MKTFWLVAMLLGLLVTAWLLMRDVQEQARVAPAPALVKPIERAAEARRTMEAAEKTAERRIEGASRE